jgi:hypothetical protein
LKSRSWLIIPKFGLAEISPSAVLYGWQHSHSDAANHLIFNDLLQLGETGVTLPPLTFGIWERLR